MKENRQMACRLFEGTRHTVEMQLNQLIREQQLRPDLIHNIQYQMVHSPNQRVHGWYSALVWFDERKDN